MPVSKWYESSTGTGDLAATIKGILIGVVPLLVFSGRALGVDISPDQLQPIAGLTGDFIIAGGVVISIAVTLFGAIRKVIMRFRK